MNPLTMALLRRVAFYSLVLAAALLAVPAALTEMGLVGPTAEERIEAASRGLDAARRYGAEGLAPFAEAARELESARRLAAQGSHRAARHAAARASERAVAAQRAALIKRDDERRQAEAIVNDIDNQVNDLEDLFSAVTPKLGKEEVSRLLSQMKEARKAGGGLFLAFEQGNYAKVVAEEPAAQQVLAATREVLSGARPRAGS